MDLFCLLEMRKTRMNYSITFKLAVCPGYDVCLCVFMLKMYFLNHIQFSFQYPEARNKIYIRGCVDAILTVSEDNLFIIGGIVLGLAVPQVNHVSK